MQATSYQQTQGMTWLDFGKQVRYIQCCHVVMTLVPLARVPTSRQAAVVAPCMGFVHGRKAMR